MIFSSFWIFWICWNLFVYSWCVLYYNLLFLMRSSDSVSFSLYMKIFKRYCWTFFEKCPRSANNFVRNLFCFGGELGEIWGVLSGPPIPQSQRQCQSSLPGETNMEKTCFLMNVYCFYKKNNEKLNKKWYWNDYVV